MWNKSPDDILEPIARTDGPATAGPGSTDPARRSTPGRSSLLILLSNGSKRADHANRIVAQQAGPIDAAVFP
ncbi:hypothetical protein GCM10020218_008650 [Dactylosporangium vinaceum]